MKIKNKVKKGIYHILVFGFGLVMLYPLFWMFMSSFKESSTIFTTAGQIIPEKFMITNYINGWKGFAGISFGTFFKNSLFISVLAIEDILFNSLSEIVVLRCSFSRCCCFIFSILLSRRAFSFSALFLASVIYRSSSSISILELDLSVFVEISFILFSRISKVSFFLLSSLVTSSSSCLYLAASLARSSDIFLID